MAGATRVSGITRHVRVRDRGLGGETLRPPGHALDGGDSYPQKEWQPAGLQLHPATIQEAVTIKLPDAKPRWPLSFHLTSVLRPWFMEVIPSDAALLEREFDRFEVLLCLVAYDLQRGAKAQGWSPVGRFARFGRFEAAFHARIIDEERAAASTSAMVDALVSADPDRLTLTLAGFDEQMRRILEQVR